MPKTDQPSAMWLEECTRLILERAPLLDEPFAQEIARDLSAATPRRDPAAVVQLYFEPIDDGLALSVIELPDVLSLIRRGRR